MKNKFTRWFLPRIPSLLIGGAGGIALNRWFHPEGSGVYMIASSALVGAVFMLWIHNDVRGVVKAFRSGAARKVVLLTVLGGLAAGLIGLLIRRLDCQAPTEYPWLFGATVWGTWWRFASIGAVLTVLQVGDHYDDVIVSPPKGG